VAYGIQTANASSESRTPDVTATSNTIVGGNSSKAFGLGFSYSLSDVDLNEGKNCYVSTASGNIIFGRQKVELNPWCAALFYDANRMHEFAAKLRCGIDDIISEYSTKDECVADQTMEPMEVVSSPQLDAVVAQYREDEDDRDAAFEEIQQQLEEQQAQYEELSAIRSRPRIVQQQAPEPYISQQLADELRFHKGEQ